MKLPWFKRKGLALVPVSIPGWLLFAAAATYAVWAFFDIDKRSHSVSDTLINWVFNCFIVALLYTIVAGLTLLIPAGNRR